MKALLLLIAFTLVGCQHGDPIKSVYGALDSWAKMEGYQPRTKREPRKWRSMTVRKRRR